MRNARRNNRETDWTWLNACTGVVDGDAEPVIEYLSLGGDPARQLNANEVALLKRPSAFDAGYTLVHLAIRFQVNKFSIHGFYIDLVFHLVDHCLLIFMKNSKLTLSSTYFIEHLNM